jgi:hypothetical protein
MKFDSQLMSAYALSAQKPMISHQLSKSINSKSYIHIQNIPKDGSYRRTTFLMDEYVNNGLWPDSCGGSAPGWGVSSPSDGAVLGKGIAPRFSRDNYGQPWDHHAGRAP